MSSGRILDNLVAQKAEFVNHARSKVYQYIRWKDRDHLIRIVEKDAYGPGQYRTHRPGLDLYVFVLGCFCTKKKYKEHELDSALTDPVVNIVCDCYSELLQANSHQLKEHLIQKILSNDIILQATLKIVIDKLKSKGLRITESSLAKLVHETVSQTAHTAAHSHLGTTIGHSITVAAGSTAGQFLINILVKAIAHHVTTITTNIIGNIAVKTVVKAAAKKVCITAITGVIVKTIATKLGFTSTMSILHVLVIGGYLTVKLIGLPREMAEKVSNGVSDTLNNSYRSCLEEILDDITDSVTDPKKIASLMTSEMVDISEFQRELEKGTNLSNEELSALENIMEKGVQKG
ncbi:unnamed protein product [Clonostachys rhizophaga]|uniref:Uncharacterized protein n=1 Tax=Clonostachys rhizophaga TaxID=160324 RepID=A0A9N9VRM0_9HYPO|nr:unnamed protein product [Clonostachys rhizophaga]